MSRAVRALKQKVYSVTFKQMSYAQKLENLRTRVNLRDEDGVTRILRHVCRTRSLKGSDCRVRTCVAKTCHDWCHICLRLVRMIEKDNQQWFEGYDQELIPDVQHFISYKMINNADPTLKRIVHGRYKVLAGYPLTQWDKKQHPHYMCYRNGFKTEAMWSKLDAWSQHILRAMVDISFPLIYGIVRFEQIGRRLELDVNILNVRLYLHSKICKLLKLKWIYEVKLVDMKYPKCLIMVGFFNPHDQQLVCKLRISKKMHIVR